MTAPEERKVFLTIATPFSSRLYCLDAWLAALDDADHRQKRVRPPVVRQHRRRGLHRAHSGGGRKTPCRVDRGHGRG